MVADAPLKAGGRSSPASDAHPWARCRLCCWRPVVRPRQRDGMEVEGGRGSADRRAGRVLSGPEIEILNLWLLWLIILIAPLYAPAGNIPLDHGA